MAISNILKSLHRYVKDRDSKYAVMLSGTWGAGKTYFLKNEIKPFVEKIGKIFLYVSVFGLKSSDDLERGIFLSAYPLFKSSKVQAVGAVLKVGLKYLKLDIDALLKVQASINENVVICIDDIERCNPDMLPSILGIVNSFVEHNKAKLILVCDEEKIENGAAYKTYMNWKEKVIGRTFIYSPTVEDQIALLINSKEISEHKSRLSTTVIKEIFLEICKIGNCANLRTIFKAFSDFSEIEAEISSDSFYSEEHARRLLRTVVALNIEVSNNSPYLEEIRAIFLPSSFTMLMIKNAQDDPALKDFVFKYFENDYTGLLNKSAIFDFVVDGYLETEELKAYLSMSIAQNNADPLEALLDDFRSAKGGVSEAAVHEVIQRIEAGMVKNSNDLRKLSSLLFLLSEKKQTKKKPNELWKCFSNGLSKIHAISAGEYAGAHSSTQDLKIFSAEHKQVLREITEKFKDQDRLYIDSYKKRVINEIDLDTEAFCDEICVSGKVMTQGAIFLESDAYAIEKKIYGIVLSSGNANEKLVLLKDAFTMRYKSEENKRMFASEKKFLQTLSSLIKNSYEPSTDAQKLMDSLQSEDNAVDQEEEIARYEAISKSRGAALDFSKAINVAL